MINLQIKESPAGYENSHGKPLLTELRAISGNCDELRAKKIARRANLPLKWIDKVPPLNGERGMEKLKSERGVLLLRNRTSPFIEQFRHPIGRCAGRVRGQVSTFNITS